MCCLRHQDGVDMADRLAVIGGGAMGSAFAAGVVRAGLFAPGDVVVSDVDEAKLAALASTLGVGVTADNAEAAKAAGVVMIAVKPAIVPEVIRRISPAAGTGMLVISIAAGVKLASIEAGLPAGAPVIRAMPNTPCLIGAGATAFSRGSCAAEEHAGRAKTIFDAVGISVEVPEKMLDAVTGLSGSGPAYVYLMIEALSDAGVRVGLPRDVALRLASQTTLGAARMVIETQEHPARLRDQVTSPGGTTIAGLDSLERAGFRLALMEAVKAATRRSEELG